MTQKMNKTAFISNVDQRMNCQRSGWFMRQGDYHIIKIIWCGLIHVSAVKRGINWEFFYGLLVILRVQWNSSKHPPLSEAARVSLAANLIWFCTLHLKWYVNIQVEYKGVFTVFLACLKWRLTCLHGSFNFIDVDMEVS